MIRLRYFRQKLFIFRLIFDEGNVLLQPYKEGIVLELVCLKIELFAE